MRYRLQYCRYRLPFRFTVRTARAVWTEREGVIIRLERAENENRNAQSGERTEIGASDVAGFRSAVAGLGYGEAAPIPEFGMETVDETEEAVRGLGEWVETERLEGVPARLGCLRNALENAREDAEARREPENRKPEIGDGTGGRQALGVAALLPAGRAVLAQLPPRLDMGFRVFKWKVGVGDVADELSLLDDVCAALPGGAKLRLDANGAWDRRKAERWLERCADRPVEFVEQPCFAERREGASAVARAEDMLLGLAGDFPTPLALDESLVGDGDVERWIGRGWPGVFVVKPSLLADARGALAQLRKAKAAVVFSSALETAVGARSALRAAFAWSRDNVRADAKTAGPRALGFGVYPLFGDARFDGPAAAPFVRWEDVERIDAEAVWNALS